MGFLKRRCARRGHWCWLNVILACPCECHRRTGSPIIRPMNGYDQHVINRYRDVSRETED
jgi:hypothetical protein